MSEKDPAQAEEATSVDDAMETAQALDAAFDDDDAEPEASPDDDPDDDDGEADAEAPKPGRKRRAEDRIGKLVREKYLAQREAEAAKAEAETVRRAAQRLVEHIRNGGQPPAGAQGQTNTPSAREIYDLARQDMQVERVRDVVVDRLVSGGAEAEFKTLASLQRFSTAALESMHDAKHAVRIARAIVSDPKRLEEFDRASDVRQAAIIARLDGQFEGAALARSGRKPLEAPPRVKPQAKPTEKDPEKMSQAEYEAWRQKQGWA